jgi:hypothetical protein
VRKSQSLDLPSEKELAQTFWPALRRAESRASHLADGGREGGYEYGKQAPVRAYTTTYCYADDYHHHTTTITTSPPLLLLPPPPLTLILPTTTAELLVYC